MHRVGLNLIVLRSIHPKDLAFWYEKLLEQPAIEEKHGNGAVHYSIQFGDSVLEVYPVDPNGNFTKITFGMVVNMTMFNQIITKAAKYRALDSNSIIISDPDDNKIIVQVMVEMIEE